MGWPHILYVAPVPLMVAALAYVLFRGLREQAGAQPVPRLARAVRSSATSGSGFPSIPISCPTSITIWEAAAPDNSLEFLLVGALVLVPMILAYTAYSYWVFRGKVNAHVGGYH